MKNNEIDTIKDIAIQLEKNDIMSAYELIKIAKMYRENGPLINEKYNQFKDRVSKKEKQVKDKIRGLLDLDFSTIKNKEKTIWMYWDSGLEAAPEIVKQSYHTWKVMNPDYEIIFLDETNLYSYLGVNLSDLKFLNKNVKLGMAGLSDLIRLLLLYKFGGVWADSTTFCHKSLSQWLSIDDLGFFIFRQLNNCKDRSMVSWFMASKQKGSLIEELLIACIDFIQKPRKNTLSIQHHLVENEETKGMISRNGTGYKYLEYLESKNRVPYFWMFYIWNEIKSKNQGKYDSIKNTSNDYLQENAFNYKVINQIKVSKNTYRPSQNRKISALKYQLICQTDFLNKPFNWQKISANAQISEKNKTIFIHIPKAGGTSIDNSNLFESKRSGHATYNKLSTLLGNRKKDFKVLTVVRNPWDRLASAFYYLSEGGSNNFDKSIFENLLYSFKGNFKGFLDDFILHPSKYINILHFRPMIEFINPEEVKEELFIQKLEDIKELSYLNDFLGEDIIIKHERKRKSYKNVEPIYNDYYFNKIKEIFINDVELFGYQKYTLNDVKN